MASNEWLVRKLHEQDKKIEALSRGGTGVGHTSIAPGENLTVISDNGEVVLGAGGVEHVDGPTPATPSAPTLKLGFGTIETTWDGSFAEGEDEDGVPLTAPVDFDVVEVHCSTDPEEEEWGEDTMRGQIKAREGGTITVGGFDVDDEVFVCLIALAKTGKRSAPSATASLVIEGLDFAQLTNELDAATVTIDNAREVLLDGQNTLGEKLDAADTALSDLETTLGELDSTTLPALRSDLDAAEGRLSEAEGQITDAFGQLDAVPGQISDARQEAIDAAQAELDQVEGTLTSMIGGKSATKWSTSNPPAQYSGSVGDTWVKLTSLGSGGREIKRSRWQGDVWVDHPVDGAVLSNVDASTVTTGFLDVANRVRAGAITASKMLIGGPENMIALSGIETGGTTDPHIPMSGATIAITSLPEYGYSNSLLVKRDYTTPVPQWDHVVRLGSGGMSPGVQGGQMWPITGGKSYRAEVTAVARGSYPSGTPNVRLNMGFFRADGVWLGGAIGDPVRLDTYSPSASRLAVAQGKAPDNAAFVGVTFQTDAPGWAVLVKPTMTVLKGGTLIEPGGIHTPHLAANVLEVGNLKAGTAAIAEAVVQKIAASTASIQQADVKNLFVTGTSSLSNVVAERIAAETAQFIELEVGNLVAGTGTMDTATINKLFADVVVASMAQAEQFIGENAILTGAVTAPKITASEELWAKIAQFVKIRAEHIEADAIDGMVITAPTIQSARSGRRWIGDPNGIRIINEDDDVRTQLSPDGSTFKGEVEAETLVVNDGAELRGATNTLAQGAKLTLAAGVTDPTAPPVVQPYWDGVEFSESLGDPRGLAWDGENYWTVQREGYKSFVPTLQLVRLNPETGGQTAIDVPIPRNSPVVYGITCVGSELFVLTTGTAQGSFYSHVYVTDLSGNLKRDFEFEDIGYSPTNPLVYEPGIGNDGTNVVIGHCSDDGTLRIRTYDKTTGAQIGSTVSEGNANFKSDITGVYVGGADDSTTRIYVNQARTGIVYPYTTAGVYDSTRRFNTAVEGSGGLVFAGGKFHTLDPSGAVHEYADNNTGDESGDWWATYYWYTDVDDDDIIEPSDYQSRMAPPRRFTWPRRAGLKILGQPLPDGVEALGPALAKKTSMPARTDFSRPGWQVDSGRSSARYVTLPTNWASRPSPPETNTFPSVTPSALESASSTFQLKGDGSGKWGPLTFNADGTMSGIPKMAVGKGETVTVTSGGFNTKTVTFPQGRFASPPTVVVSADTTSEALINVGALSVTKDGFTLSVRRTNSTPTGVDWIAMEVN